MIFYIVWVVWTLIDWIIDYNNYGHKSLWTIMVHNGGVLFVIQSLWLMCLQLFGLILIAKSKLEE